MYHALIVIYMHLPSLMRTLTFSRIRSLSLTCAYHPLNAFTFSYHHLHAFTFTYMHSPSLTCTYLRLHSLSECIWVKVGACKWRQLCVSACKWRWVHISEGECIRVKLGACKWRWVHMTKGKCVWVLVGSNKWRWLHVNDDEWVIHLVCIYITSNALLVPQYLICGQAWTSYVFRHSSESSP